MITKENYFIELSKVQCEVEKKDGLNYVSWSDAWTEVKKLDQSATYTIYENKDGNAFFESNYGIDVKVGVTIFSIEHIVRLPVMNGANKAMKQNAYKYNTRNGEKTVEGATSVDINKSIQRAFTKAIAMHGIGLYVYRGEDLPDDIETDGSENKKVDPSEYKVQESNMLNKPIFNDGKTIGQKVSEFKKIMEPYTKECKSCGTLIPDKVYEFKNLGLCFKCQKKHLDNQEKVTQEKILQKEIEDTKKDEEFGSDMNDFIRN